MTPLEWRVLAAALEDLEELRQQLAALDELPARLAAAYRAGYAAAERDIDEPWRQLSRRVRADAARLRGPVPEPATRPQHNDRQWFTTAELARLDADETLDPPRRIATIHPLTEKRRAA